MARRRKPTDAEIYDCGFNTLEHKALVAGEDYHVIWIDPDEGIYTIVDWEDYERFKRYAWHFTFNSTKRKMYATRNTRLHGRHGPQCKVYMHKEVLALCPPETHPRLPQQILGDHKNGNSLDNRRCNLKWATPSENSSNRRLGQC